MFAELQLMCHWFDLELDFDVYWAMWWWRDLIVWFNDQERERKRERRWAFADSVRRRRV